MNVCIIYIYEREPKPRPETMTRNRAVASGPLGLEWAVEPKPAWAETPSPTRKPLLYKFQLSPHFPHLLHKHTHTSPISLPLENPKTTFHLFQISVQARISDKDSVKLGSLGHFIFSHFLPFFRLILLLHNRTW